MRQERYYYFQHNGIDCKIFSRKQLEITFGSPGMLMQSYMLNIVQQLLLNNTLPVCTPENDSYANYRGQRSPSAFPHLRHHINAKKQFCSEFFRLIVD